MKIVDTDVRIVIVFRHIDLLDGLSLFHDDSHVMNDEAWATWRQRRTAFLDDVKANHSVVSIRFANENMPDDTCDAFEVVFSILPRDQINVTEDTILKLEDIVMSAYRDALKEV